MKTSFTPDQLLKPDIAEADGILKTCVHYGFCTATCPTYVLFRDENDSPRGRIDLIRAMLEKGGAPDAKTVHHLDRCLSCLSCVTTCAVKVDYHHLIDIGRSYIEKNFRRPLFDRGLRWLLSRLLPYPTRFLFAMRLAPLVRPFERLLPSRVRNLLALSRSRPASPGILKPQVFPAEGTRRMRVALLAGCAQQALDREINAATIRVLTRHGCEVVVTPGVGCCGALPLHMGFDDLGKMLAGRNVAAWRGELPGGLDAVVINASGCGTTVKDYGHLLGTEDGRTIGAMTCDITELLGELGLQSSKIDQYRVAYHDACSLQHGQKVVLPPRKLLRQAGFEVVDVPERHFCCGSAGAYNLLQPEIAAQLGQRKAEHIASVSPQIVAAGNLGCMVQIGRYSGLPMVHTVQLLDWATGGPMPPALRGLDLAPTERPVSEEMPLSGTTPESSGDVGIW